VPEGALDGDDVARGSDEARGEEVSEVVQPEAVEAGRGGGLAPEVVDGVLVRRSAGGGGEQPAVRTAGAQVPLDVRGDWVVTS
jgi:hypothetical protein